MEREHHPDQIELTGIHINLEAQAIEFEDRYGTLGRLRFTGETVLYEGQPLLLRPTPPPATAPTLAAGRSPEHPHRPRNPRRQPPHKA
jgi:hypothetical protein